MRQENRVVARYRAWLEKQGTKEVRILKRKIWGMKVVKNIAAPAVMVSGVAIGAALVSVTGPGIIAATSALGLMLGNKIRKASTAKIEAYQQELQAILREAAARLDRTTATTDSEEWWYDSASENSDSLEGLYSSDYECSLDEGYSDSFDSDDDSSLVEDSMARSIAAMRQRLDDMQRREQMKAEQLSTSDEQSIKNNKGPTLCMD